jgi:hypothetical protein
MWHCSKLNPEVIFLRHDALMGTIQYTKLYLKLENIKHYNTSSNELLNPTIKVCVYVEGSLLPVAI